MQTKTKLSLVLVIVGMALMSPLAMAACKDNVVLIHGNTGSPSDWSNTYNRLRNNGWSSSQIYRPNWGSKTCASCNDHYGAEVDTVRSSIRSAIANSCTGKIDVIGHSMGVTLGGRALQLEGKFGRVDSYVGIAGAIRGLNSCGTYPYNVASKTCGAWGLSKKSKLVEALRGKKFGGRAYSIKSYYDQIVCYGGCYVEGTHTSNMWKQNKSYTYNNYGHFYLQSKTSWRQVELIK